METTKRFDEAVTKLYNAFHKNRLNAYNCSACAVGNICNNDGGWTSDTLFMERNFDKKYEDISNYSSKELNIIEHLFVFGVKSEKYNSKIPHLRDLFILKKEAEFKGLCAVVEYLCELDDITNVMDYTKLLETENDKPKYQLNF